MKKLFSLITISKIKQKNENMKPHSSPEFKHKSVQAKQINKYNLNDPLPEPWPLHTRTTLQPGHSIAPFPLHVRQLFEICTPFEKNANIHYNLNSNLHYIYTSKSNGDITRKYSLLSRSLLCRSRNL